MAWWDDAAEAVGSGVGWLGDAAEAVVDTATEVVEEVTESGSDAADAGLDALRDGAASVAKKACMLAGVLAIRKGRLSLSKSLLTQPFVINSGTRAPAIFVDSSRRRTVPQSTFFSEWGFFVVKRGFGRATYIFPNPKKLSTIVSTS